MNDDPESADSLDPQRNDRWFTQLWGRHAFAVERDALLDALVPLDGRDLVELGCGTGRFTATLQRAGAELTGVDNDPGMLARAASRTDATLNPRSPWGLAHRRELRNPPWGSACLTTRPQRRALLAGHGRPRLHGALHAPGIRPGLAWLARVTAHAGRWAPGIGAFQTAVLDLSGSAR